MQVARSYLILLICKSTSGCTCSTQRPLLKGGVPTQTQVMNALEMDFEDDTFDLVWACESGEHMPDKAKYVQEMTRVLKPGMLP